MDIDAMINAVDKNINIYLDKLRIFTEGNQDTKVYEWIKRSYPEYINEYYNILFKQDESYYIDVIKKYKNNKRIHFLFE